MAENIKNICAENNKTRSCEDIYVEEIENSIKELKSYKYSRRYWRIRRKFELETFQIANQDYYTYEYLIDSLENHIKPRLLVNILTRMLERYGIPCSCIEWEYRAIAPVDFVINCKHENVGYRFHEIDYDNVEFINNEIKKWHVDKAVIIRTWEKSDKSDNIIDYDNKQYCEKGYRLSIIYLESFFEQYFDLAEFAIFKSYIEKFLGMAKDVIGYKLIDFLSSSNLAIQRAFEEKELIEQDYQNYFYQIINKTEKNVEEYLYLSNSLLPSNTFQMIESNYIHKQLYKSLLGTNDYALSFLTSEWLYRSIKEKNYDYTAIISGYLKSVEQLLRKIVELNVDNNCQITISKKKGVYKRAKRNNIVIYNHENDDHEYINLTSAQLDYIDDSIGAFEHFLKNNPHIFEVVDQTYLKRVSDSVSCFRIECRNGYFHTHNLYDWNVVETILNTSHKTEHLGRTS